MRQFLLGELTEKDREELEQLVLLEGGLRDKLLMAEDDLIEEYLEGSLAAEEREKFLRQFLSIPHQRNKLRIAKSLRRFALGQPHSGVSSTGPAQGETKPVVVRAQHRFYRSLLTYAPIAAVIILAVGIGAFWYGQYRSRGAQRQAIERELAELNASGQSEFPADQISTVVVPPVSSRSVVADLSSSFKGAVLEVWLLPGTQPAEKYDAVLQKVGSEDKFRVSGLALQDRAGGKAVRLRIPTRLLTPGIYRVQLSPVLADGTAEHTAEYSFEIQ